MLSIKCMFNGPATYETDDGGRFVVDDNSYLILNHQQPYTLVKDGVTPVETFCLFLGDELIQDVVHAANRIDTNLLDEPVAASAQPFHFLEKLYPHDKLVSPYIQQMRAEGKRYSNCNQQVYSASFENNGQIEEALHGLLLAMIQTQTNLFREIEQLPPARYATRVELYQRLYRARDYIHATLAEPLSLADIAQVVHLSPHHFLRAFKEAFGITPHMYLTQKRIERAQYLLTHTTHSITDICLEIGYESPSSFSNLFRRQTGLSPRAYRKRYLDRQPFFFG